MSSVTACKLHPSKLSWTSEGAAAAYRRRGLKDKAKNLRALRPYLCPDCEQWHLGHERRKPGGE